MNIRRQSRRAEGGRRRIAALLIACLPPVLAGFLVICLVATLAAPPLRRAAVTATSRGIDASLQRAPADMGIFERPVASRSVMLAADGTQIATFWWRDRQPVALAQISTSMQQAQVAIEDSRFYDHGSTDLRALLRAIFADVTGKDLTAQGASTLEQQYVKNVEAEQAALTGDAKQAQAATDKTLARKLVDLVTAAHLERAESKDQILQGYLNTVYYGNGAYGVQSAAQRYFSTDASKLSLEQSALLAGLVQSPTAYDPLAHPQAALQRRNAVLDRMLAERDITSDQYATAVTAPLGLQPHTSDQGCAASPYPYFCQLAVAQAQASPTLGATAQERATAWNRGGITLHTTLNVATQQAAQQSLTNTVPPDNSSGLKSAAAVVEPGSGHILALGQDQPYGTAPGETTVSYATDKSIGGSNGFQIGSTFKTFTLAAALEAGIPLDTVIDAPESGHEFVASDFKHCGQVSLPSGWAPENLTGDPSGPMSLTTAIAKSVNTAFVALEGQVGICNVLNTAESMGMHSSDGSSLQPVPSLTLGVFPTSPLTVAAAYATFGAGGIYCDPQALTAVDVNGATTPVTTSCRRVVSTSTARDVTTALHTAVTQGTGQTANIQGVPVAGKTGTTDSNAASWFTGYTSQAAASVWVGDPAAGSKANQNVSLNGQYYGHLSGNELAAPTWRDIMLQVLGT